MLEMNFFFDVKLCFLLVFFHVGTFAKSSQIENKFIPTFAVTLKVIFFLTLANSTMASRPLTYPALVSTIKYLDPNIRFQLVARNPSLENLGKSQTLIIDDLVLDRNSISINNVEYKLGTENKFDEDPKTLAIRQLEGRRQLINVKWLKIEGEGQILDLLERLPQCFQRFKMKMIFNWSMQLHQLIDPRSIPLDGISLNEALSLNSRPYRHIEQARL
ncbi:F-box C protein [Caenorhabditis elegans]|uniref:F-box C protein n=1 Tax=Caenorhabditis elegans TaxID=6239 RepID=P91446_CAEEL|nr:F-box C protein [Caenorhabditis elegans]CCD68948.1 F-box C protein [Caenorhabditis elegans]|eukprot:NP_494176.1 F-box C protein [Caenorhabditis elegans]